MVLDKTDSVEKSKLGSEVVSGVVNPESASDTNTSMNTSSDEDGSNTMSDSNGYKTKHLNKD